MINGYELTGSEIRYILSRTPELFEEYKTELMDGCELGRLLRFQPHLIDKCQIDKLGEFDICHILQVHPQLFDKLPTEKMSGAAISMLLRMQPQLFDKCDVKKMNGFDVRNLLFESRELLPKLIELGFITKPIEN